MNKRGVEQPAKSNDVLEKIKQTNIKRRGVAWVFQDINVRLKAKSTINEKFHVDNAMQSKDIQEKSK